MLYLIGIGLGDEKDISLNALNVLKNCDFVYLENYTSKLFFDVEKFEYLIGKKIILADRDLVENKDQIVNNALNKTVAFLVKGDVFSATTHSDLFLRAKEKGVLVKIIHNSSILTAVGDTGLSLYKFGKVASIPFDNKNVKTPITIFLDNHKLKMHTLFLLDLSPKEETYMNFKEAIKYLVDLCPQIKNSTQIIVCGALGTEDSIIKYGEINDLLNIEINIYPQCIIIPAELHFMEEEMLNSFKV
ncbi:diphthine synthase [Candidatus Woesearchaeota archaeon]|nr:diphthine synthase [Candidatus Woesearchaeota archaeon]